MNKMSAEHVFLKLPNQYLPHILPKSRNFYEKNRKKFENFRVFEKECHSAPAPPKNPSSGGELVIPT